MGSLKVLTKGSPKPPPVKPGLIRLYGMRLCPFVERAWLVLTAKQIPYDMVNIHLLEKPEWYKEVNPGGKVPALVFDNKLVTESLVIADYLDDTYPQNKLNPSDPYERARNRMVLSRFDPLTVLVPVFEGKVEPIPWWDGYKKNMEYLEKELQDRKTPYYAGDAPGMLDYMVYPWIERLDIYPQFYKTLKPFNADGKFPKLSAWKDRMAQDKVVKKIAISLPSHMDFIHSMQSGEIDYDVGL